MVKLTVSTTLSSSAVFYDALLCFGDAYEQYRRQMLYMEARKQYI